MAVEFGLGNPDGLLNVIVGQRRVDDLVAVIMDKWLERHPEIKKRSQDIRVSRGTMTLPHGGKADLIHATIIVGEDIEGYDPAEDLDLYEYFLTDDPGDREPSQNG